MKRKVPGLIKRIIAALSNKTNELRTRIMIFFLLHRNQSLLLDKFQTVVAGRRQAHRHAAASAQSLRCGKEKNGDEGSHVGCPRGGGGEEESFIMYMNTEPAMTMETSTVVDPTTKLVFSYTHGTESTPEDSSIDLTHTLFKESEEEMKKLTDNEDGASIINTMVKTLEDMDNDGRLNEEVAGEEDIDHAADVFIERFRRQILLQKQLSLQERHSTTTTQMLQHNV